MTQATPQPAKNYREVEAKHWDDLVAAFVDPSLRIFRGQRDSSWELEPSLYRHTRGGSIDEAENTVLRLAKQQVFRYLSDSQIPKSTIEWLALIQHYGGPTRLLDFTRSPYVATFFALEDATDEGRSCAVWAVEPLWCQSMAARAVGATKVDFESATLLKMYAELDEGFGRIIQANKFIGVLPLSPARLHERLVLQQGEFLCPLNLSKSFAANLTELDTASATAGRVLKIVIPNKLRPYALGRLRDMNISRATLFPGLEGFVQSLRHSVVGEKPEEAGQRALLTALKAFGGSVAAAVHETGDYRGLFPPATVEASTSSQQESTQVGTTEAPDQGGKS